jgi:2-dehydro-3-deoxyphosphogluconate aldolase/(4S)-4-hydroxy-2-oxoglutarate aldolase
VPQTRILNIIEQARMVAIMRGDYLHNCAEVASVLAAAGVKALEVSLTSPRALDIIELLAKQFGNTLAIGAGTVLTVDAVEQVYDSGAQFVLSPNLKDEVVTATLKKGLISFPGAYTPSEIIHATELGAHAVKVFPASILGPKFIRAVLAPCPGLKLIPTGGVGLEDIPLYLKAGAWAIAAASEMMSKPPSNHEEMQQLSTRAVAFAAAARGNNVA